MPIVAEIRFPGTWLDLPDLDAERFRRLLDILEHALVDAAVSLNLYATLRDASRILRNDGNMRDAEWENRRRYIARAHSLLSEKECSEARERLEEEADRAAKHASWETALPSSYASRIPFVLARNFVYGLDIVQKTLALLAKEPAQPRVNTAELGLALADFESKLPVVKHIRNSAHHPEDRMRLLASGNKPIVPKGLVLPPAVHAPGVAIHEGLLNNTYTTMTGDGSQGTIDITPETLAVASNAMRRVIAAFPWRGRARWIP